MKTNDLAALAPYCNSAAQAKTLEAVIKFGSNNKAAKALGVRRQTVDESIKRIRKNATRRGFDPDNDLTHASAPGNRFDSATTLYRHPEPGPEGGIVLQWVRQRPELESAGAAMRAYADELIGNIRPRKAVPAPKRVEADVMVGYPIGDHHFGMYATLGRAGGDYNVDKAKDVLAEAVDYLVESSPPAETGVLVNLGDFTHIDNRKNATPISGHVLDVDGYYEDICRAAAFAMAHAATRLLRKHKFVRIVNCPGNHDQDTAGWLSNFMLAWFRDEPRVTVDLTPGDWRFYQYGRNMFCYTHGHKAKLDSIPGIMATLAPEMWGATSHRYAWAGHLHHTEARSAKEHRGATVEQFGVLGPADEYARNLGYRAIQEMHSIAYRRDGGQLCRATYNPRMD